MTQTLEAQHTDLIEQAKADEAKARAEASERYRDLLARSGRPRPGDPEQLRECMGTLGITTEQLAQHVKAVNEDRRLAKLEAEIPNRQRRSDKASEAPKAAEAERDRVVAAAEAKYKQVVNETVAIHRPLQEAVRAKHERRKLREQNRELFGLPEPEAPEEQQPSLATFGPFHRDDLDECGKLKPAPAIPYEQGQGFYYVQPEAEGKNDTEIARQREIIERTTPQLAEVTARWKAETDPEKKLALGKERGDLVVDRSVAEYRLAELEP